MPSKCPQQSRTNEIKTGPIPLPPPNSHRLVEEALVHHRLLLAAFAEGGDLRALVAVREVSAVEQHRALNARADGWDWWLQWAHGTRTLLTGRAAHFSQ